LDRHFWCIAGAEHGLLVVNEFRILVHRNQTGRVVYANRIGLVILSRRSFAVNDSRATEPQKGQFSGSWTIMFRDKTNTLWCRRKTCADIQAESSSNESFGLRYFLSFSVMICSSWVGFSISFV